MLTLWKIPKSGILEMPFQIRQSYTSSIYLHQYQAPPPSPTFFSGSQFQMIEWRLKNYFSLIFSNAAIYSFPFRDWNIHISSAFSAFSWSCWKNYEGCATCSSLFQFICTTWTFLFNDNCRSQTILQNS